MIFKQIRTHMGDNSLLFVKLVVKIGPNIMEINMLPEG